MALLKLPNIGAWSGRCNFFARQLARQKHPRLPDLQDSVQEFCDIIGTYISFCAWPVYSALPKELADTMPPRAKVELAAFQQRIDRYIFDAEELLKEVGQSRPSLNNLPVYITHVKPLA